MEDQEVELRMFDVKVYKAQTQMSEAMSMRLKALGVPFFGTLSELIMSEISSAAVAPGSRPKWSPLITSTQLLSLQRRMIEYLEDMYKE